MEREELEHLIRGAARVTDEYEFIIIGFRLQWSRTAKGLSFAQMAKPAKIKDEA